MFVSLANESRGGDAVFLFVSGERNWYSSRLYWRVKVFTRSGERLGRVSATGCDIVVIMGVISF